MESLNKEEVSISDFTKMNIVLGTIIEVRPNIKAKNPAYILKIDFGDELGLKSTSAQVTNYSVGELIGRQVIAICNLPSKKVAGFTSEVLVLGAISGKDIHLLRTDIILENGTLIG